MIARQIDPITLEVVRNRLDAIADEMQYVLLRSSYSIVISEAGDATSAIFTPDGEPIAHAVAIPAHLGVMGPMVKGILDKCPIDTIVEGDVYIMNDPYAGGTHLPDVMLMTPILHQGNVIALAACLSHLQEIGGMVASSMPANSTEIYQEGLILPALKLYDKGELNQTLIDIIAKNVRLADDVLGDLRAQVAATATGRDRFLELVQEYGVEQLLLYADELLSRAERMTRSEIEKIPDGTYRFHDYLDHDGVEIDKQIRIEAAIIIDGSDFIVDFTGTDPQSRGPINGPPSSAFSAAAYVLRAITNPWIPTNGGSERALKLILPEGTVVNPRHPAPVCLRGALIRRIVDVLLGALVQALPDRIPACSASHNGAHSYAGVDPSTDRRYGITDTCHVAGMGALAGRDGTDAIEMHTTNVLNLPTETMEMSGPLLVHSTRLRPDSGGAGLTRGGLGTERVVELLRGTAVSCFRHERHTTAPWGLFGGLPGASWGAYLDRADGASEVIPAKAVFEMREGDVLTILMGGGGGYGDPLERETDAVFRDWLDGKVSIGQAQTLYGITINEAARGVDIDASERLRAELRRVRGTIDWAIDRGNGVRE